MYVEGMREGRKFLQQAYKTTIDKPIILLKSGRSATGMRSAGSHTGALAGQEAAFDAALRRAGIHRATTAEQLFDWARALAANAARGLRRAEWVDSEFRTPNSEFRVAVLTNAGGPGVMAADALEANGLALAELRLETENQLRELLPPAASVANPVDMLASASPEQYAESLRLLLADAGVDAVLVILPPPPMFSAGAVARQVIPVIQTASKPVVVALMGHGLVQEALAFFRAVNIPTYTFPEAAASALAAVSRQRSAVSHQLPAASRQPLKSAPSVQFALSTVQTPWLPQDTLFNLLNAYGIQTPAYRIVSSPAEALAAAQALGCPVNEKGPLPGWDILPTSK